jgi:hypothetical protein
MEMIQKLTVIFAGLLMIDSHEGVAAGSLRNRVCELTYHGSRDSPEYSNLIETTW